MLQRPIGRGAMGEVWVASHVTLGGELALKLLCNQDDGEDEFTAMARFRQEAQIAAKLSRRTRHIVTVTDHGEEDGRAYLVMELLEGESFEAALQRERASLELVTMLVVQIAKGLAHAHAEGVFHRDLKPANLWLARDEDGGLLVKILDFGNAKATRAHKGLAARTEAGMVLGTPTYMSPEQARGLASLDHRCDLWALAVVAYEALCGALPYDGETTNDMLVNVCSADPIPARHFRPDLPPALDEFFARAFNASVHARFPDALSFAQAFYAAATVVPAPEPVERPSVRARPRRAPWVLALLGLGVVASVAASRLAPRPLEARPVSEVAPSAPPVAPEVASNIPTAVVEKLAPSAQTSVAHLVAPAKKGPPQKPSAAAPSASATAKPLDKGEIL